MNQRVKEKNKWIDRLINFVFYGCVLALIWLLLQITTFSSFRIPTASMHPTLIKGDYVIVNKWIAGGRIFNVFNAVKNKHISIKRIPGIRRIRKNDILIFNSPVGQYKNRIHFDVMQYYAKRCVGLPGDTVAIILPTLSALVEDSLTFSFDHNYYDLLGWTAEKFGPLYIPCKGDQIPINSLTATQYGSVMEWETKQKIDYKDSAYFIGNHRFTNYQFKHDYYFMLGDNIHHSLDSRHWGLVPDDFIVGVVQWIWFSKDEEQNSIRWNQIGRVD